MSATKSFLLSLLIAAFTPSSQSQTLPIYAFATSTDALGGLALVSLRGAAVPTPAGTFFTDQQPDVPGSAARSPDKWLVLLLSVALVAYQLRRNQRTLNHQLTNR
jgi:hypothetical protein